MKRTTEFVLGLIGGIFGILCACIALFIGELLLLWRQKERVMLV